MSQVTNVRVVYGRKRQPAQYESSSAEVEFIATVGDEENHVEVAKKVLADAKTLVLTELGLVKPGESASAHVRAGVSEVCLTTPVPANDPPAATAAEPTAPKNAGRKRNSLKEATETPPQTSAAAPSTSAPPASSASSAPSAAAGIPVDDAPASSGKPETALGRVAPVSAPAATQAAKPSGGAGIPDDAGTSSPAPAAAQQKPAAAGGGEGLTAAAVQKFITGCLVAKKFAPQDIMTLMKEHKIVRVQDITDPELLQKFYNIVKAKADAADAKKAA